MWKSSESLIDISGALRRIAAVAVLALGVGTGCQSWVEQRFGAVSTEVGPVEKNKPGVQAETETQTKAAEDADLESILADGDGWAEAIHRSRQNTDDARNARDARDAGPRWRNRMLEDILSRSRPDRNLLLRAMDGSDNVAAANAAIALARLGDSSGEKRLAASVRSGRLKLPLRSAAAEAIGSLRSPSVVATLRKLIAQYGDFRLDRKSQYVASLHVELLLGLAKHVAPGGDPRFLESLDSPDAKVRLVAVEVWSKTSTAACGFASNDIPSQTPSPSATRLPDAVADMTGDTDPRVRCEAFLAVARRGHRQAKDRLAAGLRDGDIYVRIAAIEAMGQWADAAGRLMLLPLLDDRSSMIRAAAVRSLWALGAADEVLAAAKDKAWQVRAAVAQSLSRKKGPGPFLVKEATIDVALDLLADPSLAVQKQVILAVASWPLAEAGPILLAAIERDSPRTRKLAAEQLATLWPPAAQFPFAAPKKRRDEVLARLRQEFMTQYSVAPGVKKRTGTLAGTSPLFHAEEIERAQLLLAQLGNARTDSPTQRRAVAELVGFGSKLSGVLAVVSIDRRQPLPEIVYEEILPSCDPVFEILYKLQGEDVMVRRHAATKLAALAAEKRLDRLATSRLAALIVREPDQLVWQYALRAVADNDDKAAVRIAYAAVGHDSAQVRWRACEYLGAWPHPRHANVLLPAIEDANVAVAKAAVFALGRCGNPRHAQTLKSLLPTGNASLRLETAAALVRLGDPAGAAALRRLAHHGDPKIRRETARAMGRSGDAGFIPILILLLDDRAGVRREALAALSLLSGYNPAGADGGDRKTSAEVVELWKRWHAKQSAVMEKR